jgi:hypothetical protein
LTSQHVCFFSDPSACSSLDIVCWELLPHCVEVLAVECDIFGSIQSIVKVCVALCTLVYVVNVYVCVLCVVCCFKRYACYICSVHALVDHTERVKSIFKDDHFYHIVPLQCTWLGRVCMWCVCVWPSCRSPTMETIHTWVNKSGIACINRHTGYYTVLQEVATQYNLVDFEAVPSLPIVNSLRGLLVPSLLYRNITNVILGRFQKKFNTTRFVCVHARVEYDIKQACTKWFVVLLMHVIVVLTCVVVVLC